MSNIITLPKPLDYQKEMLDAFVNDKIDTIVFKKGRQSGGSYFAKMVITKYLLENTNKKCMYLTPAYKLAKSFYVNLEKSLKPFIMRNNSVDLYLEFSTGSSIQFFSGHNSYKDSIRGFNAHLLIIDEAAFIDDDVYYYAIKPSSLVLGEKKLFISSPNTAQGFFYDVYNLAKNGEEGFYLKEVNIYDNPFVKEVDIEQIKRQIPKRVFKQEYLAEFLDGDGAVFTNYKNCINDNPKLTGKYYAAIDLAKQQDYTVLTIMNELSQVVHIYRVTGLDYTTQVKSIVEVLNKWNPIKILVEKNNIGDAVIEMLKLKWSGRISEVTLNNSLKRELIENLVVAFEQEKISIPNNDDLLRELQSFTVEYNPKTGNVFYGARIGMHDDTVISLAYAYSITKLSHKKRLDVR